jgi:multiple sugar transport system permease protein
MNTIKKRGERMKPKINTEAELPLVSKVFVYTMLITGLVIFIFPIYWMLATSLKSMSDINEPTIWPAAVHWENYIQIFIDMPLGKYMWNTIWYATVSAFAVVFTSSMVAYAFARLQARGSSFMFMIVLSTMMVPMQVTMIPQYLLFNKIGWMDTYLPLVLPAFGTSAFIVFLLRQFYMGISKEIDEATRIDGGGYFTIFFRMMLPLTVPAMISAVIIEFMWRWNDLMGPLIYLNSNHLYPLSLGLTHFTGERGTTQWNLLMAGSMVAVLPPLILFFLLQKYFIKGITISGSKG